jgi:hypothetical protein
MRLRSRFNRGDVGMGPLLGRGLGRGGRHYDRAGVEEGTLMRHFLRLALAPSALPGGVPTRPAVAALVAPTGTQQRLAPAYRRAFPRAVPVAAVALTADAHLLRAAPAAVQPIRLLACPHAPRTQHWTTPRIAGIKAGRTRPHPREHAEGPGFFQERARAFVYSVSRLRIARDRPRATRGLRLGHIASAASMVDGVWFNQTAWLDTPGSPLKPLARANSAVNDSGGAARKSSKSGGSTSPLTPQSRVEIHVGFLESVERCHQLLKCLCCARGSDLLQTAR